LGAGQTTADGPWVIRGRIRTTGGNHFLLVTREFGLALPGDMPWVELLFEPKASKAAAFRIDGDPAGPVDL
jgi:hypothetical protein